MKPPGPFIAGLLVLTATACALVPRAEAQSVTGPIRTTSAERAQAPYASTGIMDIAIGRYSYRGSGAVARDPRIVYTCGHNVFDGGAWASALRFARAWHGAGDAPGSAYAALRGYRQLAGYADAASRYGDSSSRAFAADFAVGFGTAASHFGDPLTALLDGVAPLRSSAQKMILGYPAELDHNGASGGHYLHRTGPFSAKASVVRNPFLDFDRVATGPGNSGGPALVAQNGGWSLAGILVAGSRSSAGVFGLNTAAHNTATEAIAAAGGDAAPPPPAPEPDPTPNPNPNPSPNPDPAPIVERTLSNAKAFTLRDGSTAYHARHYTFSRLPSYATGVKLSLDITTSYRGDLDVYLRSPSGRIRWVAEHDAEDDSRDLRIAGEDLTASYAGADPNGRWSLFMRDYFPQDRARYRKSSLTISSR